MGIRRRAGSLGIALVAALALPASAQDAAMEDPASGTREAFLEALARMPSVAGGLASPVSYIDYRAVELARPGAARPASVTELLALREAGDPSADAWFAASMGISSGPAELLTDLFSMGSSFPESVGFDFFDIDRAVEFGVPPSDGLALLGRFDPAAIAAAHEARGYAGTPAGERTLWCGEVGCDGGMLVDLARRDPRVPFGGQLGRQEPLAVSERDVLSSADLGTLEAMLAAAGGEAASLAAEPAIRALALAPSEALLVIQAILLGGDFALPIPDLILGADTSPETAAEGLADFAEEAASLGEVPVAEAIAIIDGATATEQVLTVALAYADDADAATAAEGVVERLGAARSLTREAPLGEILDERGVTSVTGRVTPATPQERAVAVIEVRAPLAGTGSGPTDDAFAPSSQLYRLFQGMVYTFDLLWLAPSGPAG